MLHLVSAFHNHSLRNLFTNLPFGGPNFNTLVNKFKFQFFFFFNKFLITLNSCFLLYIIYICVCIFPSAITTSLIVFLKFKKQLNWSLVCESVRCGAFCKHSVFVSCVYCVFSLQVCNLHVSLYIYNFIQKRLCFCLYLV